jgi:hypothetical protein
MNLASYLYNNNQDKLFQFEDSIAREDINEADTSKDETQSKIILSEKEIQTVIATTCASTQTEEVETVMTNFMPLAEFELTTLVVIDSDCIVSYKSNYHTITTTTTLGGLPYSSTNINKTNNHLSTH